MILALESASNLAEICVNLTLSVNHDLISASLGDNDQMVEIAIVDSVGTVLFESYVKPIVDIDPEAQAIHGISDDSLADAPEWPEIAEKVRSALDGKTVVIFNAGFDVRILKQTAKAHGPVPIWLEDLTWWPQANAHQPQQHSSDLPRRWHRAQSPER